MYSYVCARTVNDWQNTRDFWSLLSLSSSQSWLVLTFQQIRCEYLPECIKAWGYNRLFTLWIDEQCEFYSSYSCTLWISNTFYFLSFSLSLSLSLSLRISYLVYVYACLYLSIQCWEWKNWNDRDDTDSSSIFPLTITCQLE